MHAYPHLREALDRSRRADLKRSAYKQSAHFSTLRLRLSARRLAPLGGLSAFQRHVRRCRPRRRQNGISMQPNKAEGEADLLTSEGLIGPKRADKAPARRRADKRSLSVLTSFSCCLFFHLLRVVAGACGAVHLRPVVESLLGGLDLIYVSAPDLHRLSLQRPCVGERELPRQTPV